MSIDWKECERIADLPPVDEAIRNLLADQTGDNATCVIRAVLESAQPQFDVEKLARAIGARIYGVPMPIEELIEDAVAVIEELKK